ncbi:uncharacterized protein [Mytilus edulis]|uniref:uncharacterized protein n=1 Tax=Mytilus edulis TaxID=6550 RepID=UPI0039F0B7FA
MITSPFEPTIYTAGDHTYKIENFLHVYLTKQKDIVLVGLIHFYAKAPILKPGMKGIYLTVDQYRKLISKRDSISNAIKHIKEDIEGKGSSKMTKTKQTNKDGQVETDFDISENKTTIVKSDFIFGSNQVHVVVDIRDNSRPNKPFRDTRRFQDNMDKAVILTEKQWNSLLSLHLKVIRDLADNFGYSEDFADELSSYLIE